MELSIFRNQLIHLFVMEGLIACGVCQLIRTKPSGFKGVLHRSELMTACAFLSTIMKLEFIFKPSEVRSAPAIEANFNVGLERMCNNGVLQGQHDDTLVVEDEIVATACGLERAGHKGIFSFLCALFCPFVDSYWLAALALYKLLPDKLSEEAHLVAHAQVLGEKLYFDSQLDHYEAVAKETVGNAFIVFGEMGIIRRIKVHGQPKRSLQLTEKHRSEGKLLALVQRIHGYRWRVHGAGGGVQAEDLSCALELVLQDREATANQSGAANE